MATTQCPVCALTVPYYCCEGLVCPACGYDESQEVPTAQPDGAGAENPAIQPATEPPPAKSSPR